jgi:hypothetical protein
MSDSYGSALKKKKEELGVPGGLSSSIKEKKYNDSDHNFDIDYGEAINRAADAIEKKEIEAANKEYNNPLEHINKKIEDVKQQIKDREEKKKLNRDDLNRSKPTTPEHEIEEQKYNRPIPSGPNIIKSPFNTAFLNLKQKKKEII